MYVSSIFEAIASQQKVAPQYIQRSDVPLLRIPSNCNVGRLTCRYSFDVSFNENISLLTALAPCTCRPFSERFLRDKKWHHNIFREVMFLYFEYRQTVMLVDKHVDTASV